MKVFARTIALVPFLWATVALAADGIHFRSQADEYLSELARQDKFSGSVFVATDGNIMLAKGVP